MWTLTPGRWPGGDRSLRDSERRFRALTEQLPVGVFMTDAQGEYRYVNDRWCQLTGLTAEQAAGSGWISALHPEDRESMLHAWRQAVKGGSEFVAQHRFRTPSGREPGRIPAPCPCTIAPAA